jgi:hypothetical protein
MPSCFGARSSERGTVHSPALLSALHEGIRKPGSTDLAFHIPEVVPDGSGFGIEKLLSV